MQILAIIMDRSKVMLKVKQKLDYWATLVFVLNIAWSVLFEGESFGLTTRKWLRAPSRPALFLPLKQIGFRRPGNVKL